LPRELFAGTHELLDRGYSPMTVRFFMLQSHYSSTLDFSNEALSAAEKGFKRLANALANLKQLEHAPDKEQPAELATELDRLVDECFTHMSDDFNTARTLAVLFEMSSRINDFKSGNRKLSEVDTKTFDRFKNAYTGFMEDVLGLNEEKEQTDKLLNGTIQVLVELRKKARQDRNFALSDKIRDDLKTLGVQLMDGKDGEMSYVIE
jgi:cysteinyl-tRNA synthetase